jgi:hypothetical protein
MHPGHERIAGELRSQPVNRARAEIGGEESARHRSGVDLDAVTLGNGGEPVARW